MRDQRNGRILDIARLAEHVTALTVTNGIRQLQAERIRAIEDGPDRGESVGRSTDTTSTTERQAAEGYRIGLLIEDLRDAVHGFEIAHRHLLDLANDACRTRAFSAPATPGEDQPKISVCRDQQMGRAGVIEWGDPLCIKAAVKAGLCGQHYMCWYRYRTAHGISTDHEFERGAA